MFSPLLLSPTRYSLRLVSLGTSLTEGGYYQPTRLFAGRAGREVGPYRGDAF